MTHIPKYADEAAFPQPHQKKLSMNENRDLLLPAQWGMTKLEYAAIQIAAGMCAAEGEDGGYWADDKLASRAVKRASALLADLAKVKS